MAQSSAIRDRMIYKDYPVWDIINQIHSYMQVYKECVQNFCEQTFWPIWKIDKIGGQQKVDVGKKSCVEAW